MEYFYREIERKLTQHNFDTLAFRDVACNVSKKLISFESFKINYFFCFVFQLFDSIAPTTSGCVTLRDLKKCGLAHRFFNTFVNYLKYLDQEASYKLHIFLVDKKK